MEEYKTAQAALKTSVFKWSPDYISAAHYFDKAGEKFNLRGDKAKALQAYSNAADAHSKAKQPMSAAKSLHHVAELNLAEQKGSNSVETYARFKQAYQGMMSQIAVIYGEDGSAQRAAAVEFEAAKGFEEVGQGLSDAKAKADANECALGFYSKCIHKLVHSDRAVFSVDAFPAAVGFCVKTKQFAKALEFLEETVKIYIKLNQTRRKYQCYLTGVVIHLARNDIVAARNAFSSHFDDTDYLKSRECEAAESLLTACENRDEEEIEKIVKGHVVNALNPPIAALARSLTRRATPVAPNPVPQKKMEFDMSRLTVSDDDKGQVEDANDAKNALFAKKRSVTPPTVPAPAVSAEKPAVVTPQEGAGAATSQVVGKEEAGEETGDGDDLDFLM